MKTFRNLALLAAVTALVFSFINTESWTFISSIKDVSLSGLAWVVVYSLCTLGLNFIIKRESKQVIK